MDNLEPGIANVIARGLELRRQRAEALRAARKFTPLDRSEIEPIRERAEKATPGPYRVRKVAENGQFYVESLGTYGHSQRWIAIANCYASPEEADFVMHCHGDVPVLLLDNLFLRHYLDGLQDEANGRLDELNDARSAIRDLRACLRQCLAALDGAEPQVRGAIPAQDVHFAQRHARTILETYPE